MTQHKDVLIKIAFEKADEAIKSAESSIKDGFLSTAQNRIYYAIFYSVVALGYFYEFSSSKHSPYLSWFNKKFIYTDKIFDEKLFKIYKEAYENRQKSDYEFMWKPVKEDIINDLNDSKFFINQIKIHLR
ncbi:MAG TPA: hypothetical protein DDW90_04730 [Cyanobacteria bacterium UBA9971]|nr:hypothetical protein [Cyanobacteria bacterium UBA9971]